MSAQSSTRISFNQKKNHKPRVHIDKSKSKSQFSTNSRPEDSSDLILQHLLPPAPAGFLDLSSPVPLENEWCFWFDKYPGPNLTQKDYENALISIGLFNTVQGFWGFYNHLPIASEIQMSSSLHLMKSGLKPIWEDEGNRSGGHLVYKVRKDDVNFVWRQLALCVIGEQFHRILQMNDDICGASVSLRKNEAVISIWNKEAKLIKPELFSSLLQSVIANIRLDIPSYRVHS